MLRLSLVSLLWCSAIAGAGDIGFIEDFALAKDRGTALKQLIPGTEDYYYYHALHALNGEAYDRVRENFTAWHDRFGQTPRLQEIQTRLLLATYERDPKTTLEYLRSRLKVQFNHEREILGQSPDLPTKFDNARISRATLFKESFPNWVHADNFESSALDWLAAKKLDAGQRRVLLSRLVRPDLPNLVELVAADLAAPNSTGFGGLNIHRLMTLAQLDDLLKQRPKLLAETNFVNIYLTKLQPGADDDWRRDPAKTSAYLDRLLEFTRRLSPVFNSLKAHVLFHKLAFDRAHGKFDKVLFLEYLKLPRQQGYMAKAALESDAARRFPVNLNADYNQFTLLPPIHSDEPLVRSYLQHFFAEADSWKEFEDLIGSNYLKHLFATTKIELGLGEPEKWASDLPPELFAALKNRIDIDFAATNKPHYDADEAVTLNLAIKNVPTLIVKVYEINAFNYYREFKKEIDTDVNLDGLVANSEQTFNYAEPPLRRIPRQFAFPQLTKPGVYVVDFIGGGKSSRALIRKGRLRPIISTGTLGQVVRVVDEKNRSVPEVSVWFGGTEYQQQNGAVIIPFSTAPGRQPIVIRHGDFASLDFIDNQPENYRLVAGIYVDREQLLAQRLANVMVRPSITLNGQPVSTKLLEEVKLRLVGVDIDGVSTATEVNNFKLFEDRESIHEFRVPPRLASLTVTLTAKVKSLTQHKSIDVADSQTFTLNGILRTAKIEDVHLARYGSDYVIELLGRTGEAMGDRPVPLVFKHRDFRNPVHVSLKTDAKGRVMLGELADILWVQVGGEAGGNQVFALPLDHHSWRSTLDAKAGDVIRVPWLDGDLTRLNASLLEVNTSGVIVADRFDKLAVRNGLLELTDLAAGDYDLAIKRHGVQMRIRIVDGSVFTNWVLGTLRDLELAKLAPLTIASASADAETVTIKLANASQFARVHVIASRYLPEYSAYGDFSKVRDAALHGVYPGHADSVYLTGRAIGDEMRYVYDRKYQKKYPGNMLNRPELLLNPWAVRSTESGEQLAQAGGQFGGLGAVESPRPAPAKDAMKREGGSREARTNFANLDFLADTSVVLANIVPDKDGIVTVKKAAFGGKQFITVVAVDPLSTTVRHLSLPESPEDFLDLRLRAGLDPKGYFTQMKTVSILGAKKDFVLADAAAGRFEAYDSMPRLFALYSTLLKDPKLAEFAFITKWPALKLEEKQAQYSKYACHELSFFLFKRDPEFFKTVVKPYLANKKDKTFLDWWLLDADVNEYVSPWKHGRLNVAEQVMLAQRIAGEPAKTARHLSDLFKLLPPNLEREVFLFDSSVAASAMDGKSQLGEFKRAEREKLRGGLAFESVDTPRNAAPGIAGRSGAPSPKPGDPQSAGKPMVQLGMGEEKLAKQDQAKKEMAERQRDGSSEDKRKTSDGPTTFGSDHFFRNDRAAGLKLPAQLYRRVEPTMEWAENNYYKLPIAVQIADLVGVNQFWIDYAKHDGKAPFLSKHVASASRNFTEVMLALAVTDLPFESPKHETKFDAGKMTFTPGGAAIAFHEEVSAVAKPEGNATILVNQNFYKADDRYRDENGERSEKYVTAEFVIHTVYGCQVVVTNPTPSRQKLAVLLQIPVGSLPLAGGKPTRTVLLDLEPYRTQTIDYSFYFPQSGQFAHFPVQVAKNEKLVATAAPFTFNVVDKPTKLDTESWDYVSQNGTPEQVIAFLERENVNALNLERIAWRMKDAAYFKTVVGLLANRHVYNSTLWSYSLLHNEVTAARTFLQYADQLYNETGQGPLTSPLVSYDPVLRHTYEHLEYKPLINARAHSLGSQRQIVNQIFLDQYHRYLKQLSYRGTLTDTDKLAVVYYLLLQDRVEEALGFFATVDANKVTTKLQYDYCAAYVAMYDSDPKRAREIAAKHATHPVDRWRNAFQAVLSQVDEIDGKPGKLSDAENRLARQTEEAAKQPSFDFTLDNKSVNLNWQNVETVTINYYLMDVELLFSRNPFVTQTGNQFAMIKPNATKEIKLPAGQAKFAVLLPEDLAKQNVFVEVVAAGKRVAHPYYANAMDVKISDAYGQLKVTGTTGTVLPKVYVKAHIRTADGQVKFHKDGYTDLRGRFDYASVSTPEKSPPVKYALLILSDEFGAVIREVNPPQQ